MLLQTWKGKTEECKNSTDRTALTFRKMLTVDVLCIRQPHYRAANLADV
jgi:hypothetical protein